MKTIEKIKKLSIELNKLYKQHNKNQRSISNRWRGRFVCDNRKGNFIDPKPTLLGFKELKKYRIEYLEEPIKLDFMTGVSYTPKKCFCMICGTTETSAYIQYGTFARFATCPKHIDFIHSSLHLKKNNANSQVT